MCNKASFPLAYGSCYCSNWLTDHVTFIIENCVNSSHFRLHWRKCVKQGTQGIKCCINTCDDAATVYPRGSHSPGSHSCGYINGLWYSPFKSCTQESSIMDKNTVSCHTMTCPFILLDKWWIKWSKAGQCALQFFETTGVNEDALLLSFERYKNMSNLDPKFVQLNFRRIIKIWHAWGGTCKKRLGATDIENTAKMHWGGELKKTNKTNTLTSVKLLNHIQTLKLALVRQTANCHQTLCLILSIIDSYGYFVYGFGIWTQIHLSNAIKLLLDENTYDDNYIYYKYLLRLEFNCILLQPI